MLSLFEIRERPVNTKVPWKTVKMQESDSPLGAVTAHYVTGPEVEIEPWATHRFSVVRGGFRELDVLVLRVSGRWSERPRGVLA